LERQGYDQGLRYERNAEYFGKGVFKKSGGSWRSCSGVLVEGGDEGLVKVKDGEPRKSTKDTKRDVGEVLRLPGRGIVKERALSAGAMQCTTVYIFDSESQYKN